MPRTPTSPRPNPRWLSPSHPPTDAEIAEALLKAPHKAADILKARAIRDRFMVNTVATRSIWVDLADLVTNGPLSYREVASLVGGDYSHIAKECKRAIKASSMEKPA
jgi:hypothetical protein